jgi:Protein of unknown function (DUF3102)
MNQVNLSSKLIEGQSTQQTLNFEYGILEAETRMVVQQCTNEIKTLMRRTSQDIIDIGEKLTKVKQHLGHGNFINWLKSEFNWSRSAATKFMQVAEQFKFVNFTNLNITASALYLIAAPSIPKKAREEVLERASLGENISYTKAKAIVCQYRKPASIKPDEPANVIEPTGYETSAVCAQEDLTQKEAQTETRSLLSKESLPYFAFEDKQIATTIKNIPDDTTQTVTSMENQVSISYEILDVAIADMAISIKNLAPEQLALVIKKSANNGLSNQHLKAIITTSQQVLNKRV